MQPNSSIMFKIDDYIQHVVTKKLNTLSDLYNDRVRKIHYETLQQNNKKLIKNITH